MKKIKNFGKFSNKKFRVCLLLVCLSYLKAGLLGILSGYGPMQDPQFFD